MKNHLIKSAFIFPLIIYLCSACTDSIIEIPQPTGIVEEGDNGDDRKIYIVDATNKAWDITHAVKNYGFEPQKFEFGLGPKAIRPILNPVFVCEGETGYPADDSNLLVIGTSINAETRAYSIIDMRAHEIVDDQFGEAHVAVGY